MGSTATNTSEVIQCNLIERWNALGAYLIKAREFIKSKLPSLKFKGALRGVSLLFVLSFAVLIFLTAVLYLAGWVYLAVRSKTPVLDDLIILLNTLTKPEFIAGLGFLGLALIDKDGDGKPDTFENQLKNNSIE